MEWLFFFCPFSPAEWSISDEIPMHSAGQNIFSHCVGMQQEQGWNALGMKRRKITIQGRLQCSKGNKTHQERHSEAYFLHVLNALKHDAFPFKNSEPTGITILYFFGSVIHSCLHRKLCCKWDGIQQSLLSQMEKNWHVVCLDEYAIKFCEKNIYKNESDAALLSTACSVVHGTENKQCLKTFYGSV